MKSEPPECEIHLSSDLVHPLSALSSTQFVIYWASVSLYHTIGKVHTLK